MWLGVALTGRCSRDTNTVHLSAGPSLSKSRWPDASFLCHSPPRAAFPLFPVDTALRISWLSAMPFSEIQSRYEKSRRNRRACSVRIAWESPPVQEDAAPLPPHGNHSG